MCRRMLKPHSPTQLWHWSWVEILIPFPTCGMWTQSNSKHVTTWLQTLRIVSMPLVYRSFFNSVVKLLGCAVNIKRNLNANPYNINKISKCKEWSISLWLKCLSVRSFSVISEHGAQCVNNVIYFDLFNFCIKKGKKKTFNSNILTFFYTGFCHLWTLKIL